MSHSWCRDIERDEAIRAAEDAAANWRRLEVGEVIEEGDEFQKKDGNWLPVDHAWVGEAVAVYHRPHRRRRVPPPDSRDLPAAVAELRERVARLEAAANPRPDPGTGWRLLAEDEVIEQGDEWLLPPAYLDNWEPTCCQGDTPQRTQLTYRRRVVADATLGSGDAFAFDEIVRLTAERDAAIRERDAAREEAEKATALAKGLEEKRLYFRLDRDAAREECERLKARAAELESNANAATILAKIRESEWNVASALAAEANAELSSAPAANAGGVSNPEPISGAGKSRGSGNQEPVLYGVLWEGRPRVEAWDVRDTEEQAVRLAGTDGTVIPLCAAPVAESATTPPPRGWLTRHERWRLGEMVAWLQGRAAEHPDTIHGGLCESYAADIAALLARSSPPRVQLPPEIAGMYDAALVRNAIRAAGGEVE